ncbi:MAG TPA: GNAT family N-acetyltransferase [Steroidobacteraceae bacterium]|nr:GNAT family N-acetyltransferase [Steroidobacteraceae bacterium]
MSVQPGQEPPASDVKPYCEITGFQGFEGEMLRLRNTNRDNPETLAFLRWRYERAPDAPEPLLFWLLSPQGDRIGMAAAIFHAYWVNGERVQVAVIGDISVDATWRGRGLGQLLLRHMSAHLGEHFPRHPALVIPTDSARRAFVKIGWTTAAALAPLVYLLDPARYLRPVVRSERLARGVGHAVRAGARLLVRRYVRPGDALSLSQAPEASFDALVRQISVHAAVRDSAREALEWRYVRHPHTQFVFATLRHAGEPRGYLVFEESTLSGTCSIYDLFASSPSDLRALLALFILRGLATPGLASVRVLLDERHPCRAQIRRLGFISRSPETVLQVHSRDGSAERIAWRVSQGDKDT